MNMTHALRIAWKDYRRIGGLWIAFFGFWTLCLGLSIGLAFYNQDFRFPATLSQASIGVLTTVLIYALSWAGLTFAAEHEDKTFGFLRSLPVSPISVFYGKVLFGVVSSFLLACSLLLLRFIHSGVLASQGGGYAQQGVAAWSNSLGVYLTMACVPLAIAAGLFWSLCLKRPLRSLVITAVSLVVVAQLCIFAASVFFDADFAAAPNGEAVYGTTVASLLIFAVSVVVFLVDRRLALSWLPNYQTVGEVPKPVAVAAAQPWSFRRLFWLAIRTNGWTCCMLLVLGVVSAFCMIGPLAVIASGMLGLVCFRPEHEEKRFRLLAQLGVNRTEYWLSRLLLPVCSVLVIVAMCIWSQSTYYPTSPSDPRGLGWAAACLIIFSLGHICSLAFGSLVIAGAATLLATIAVYMWVYVCEQVWVPWPLIYLPPIFLPLVASYLRVPRWFRETGSWKQWIVPAVPLLLLFVGAPLAAAIYRVYEIPSASVPDDIVGAQPTAAEEAKMEEYRQLFAQLPNVSGMSSDQDRYRSKVSSWVSDNEYVVLRLRKATESGIGFPQEYNQTDFGSSLSDPADLVGTIFITKAALAANEADPAKAWDYYAAALRFARQCNDGHSGSYGWARSFAIEQMVFPKLVPWAMLPDTNQQQLEEAIDFLQDHRKQQTSLRDVMRGDYAQTEKLLNNPQVSAGNLSGNSQAIAQVLHFAPWELLRARRFRDYCYAEAAETFATAEARERYDSRRPSITPTFLQEYLLWTPPGIAGDEFTRSGAICQLASILHRMKTGEYPKDLNEIELATEKLQIVLESEQGNAAPFICASDVDLKNMDPQDPDFSLHTDDVTRSHVPTMLLLPMEAEWDLARYQQRMYAHSINGQHEAYERRLAIEGQVASLDAESPSLSTPISSGDTTPAARFAIVSVGYGPDVPSTVGILTETNPDALIEFAEDFVRAAILSEDDSETQLEVLSMLVGKKESVKFVPEFVKLLDSGDIALAARASEILQQLIVNRWLTEEQLEVIRPHRSMAEGTNVMTSFGIPIRNPGNGHYYELISGFDDSNNSLFGLANSWHDALKSANSRRFRGMHGHLVTITSAEEDAFLSEMLSIVGSDWDVDVGRAWIGGRKEANEKQWTWATGPERGQPFGEAGESYIRWESDSAFDTEEEKYLAWAYSSIEDPEMAIGTWVAADKYQLPQGWLLVEYSVEEEQPSAEVQPESEDESD